MLRTGKRKAAKSDVISALTIACFQKGKGICSVRLNEAGTLKTENFGETAMHVDPVEKTFISFKPGKRILSVELMDVICHVILPKLLYSAL